MPTNCPPPVPPAIVGCSVSYLDWIIIPYAELLQEWLDEKILCPEFCARVEDLEVRYEGACSSES